MSKASAISIPELGIDVAITFFTPDIVRIQKYPSGKAPAKKSYAVTAKPVAVKTVEKKAKNLVSIASSALTVELDTASCRLRFLAPCGCALLSEKPEGASFAPGAYGTSGEVKDTRARQSFRLDPDESLYGFGQHQTGLVDQRNQRLHLCQINMESAVPFVQSTKGYGIFWDNTSPTDFEDCPTETSFTSQCGSMIDYYFVGGGSVDVVLGNFQRLTGGAPLPPLWSFGYCQSKERYVSQFELEASVRHYRDLGVPLDVIIQDWRYWGGEPIARTWNSMTFYKPTFPDAKGAFKRIHDMDAHILISIWPNFGADTAAYADLKKANHLLCPGGTGACDDNSSLYDPWNADARKHYWELLKKELVPAGADGWWMDASEPEHSYKPVLTMWPQHDPLDVPSADGNFRAVHNSFPLVHVEGVVNNQLKDIPDRRPVVLTRSAFAGQQRTGAYVWSGDVASTWASPRRQIPAGLNFSMTGLPLWNTDIGGFFGDVEFAPGCFSEGFRELYVRWLQFGLFCPMMRSHGTATPREIWNFGKRGDWAFDAIEKNIRLRYALLPYIYSTAWDISKNGGSFLYPLALVEPENRAFRDTFDEFMFGKSILVAPVLEPMYVKNDKTNLKTVKSRKVVFPSGKWWCFHCEKACEGTFDAPAPIDLALFFLKAGTILPIGPDVQFSTEKPWDNLEVRVYPGADGSFTLYEDAFEGNAYLKGERSEIVFAWDDKAKALSISARKGSFPGMLAKRTFRIRLAGTDKVAEVAYAGKAVKVSLK